MRIIKGKVIKKGERWFTVKLQNINSEHMDLLLINKYSSFLNEGDEFSLNVESKIKKRKNYQKWCHIPVLPKDKPVTIVLGIGLNDMAFQPVMGNVYVKNGQVFLVKQQAEKKNNGWEYGYSCDEWWRIVCEVITDTDRGQKILKEII